MANNEAVRVKVDGGVIAIRKKQRSPLVQLKTHVSPELSRRLKLFAAANDLTMQAVIQAGIEAVLAGSAVAGTRERGEAA